MYTVCELSLGQGGQGVGCGVCVWEGGRVGWGVSQCGGDVAQLVERRTGTPPTQVRFPGAARDFSSRANFQ